MILNDKYNIILSDKYLLSENLKGHWKDENNVINTESITKFIEEAKELYELIYNIFLSRVYRIYII